MSVSLALSITPETLAFSAALAATGFSASFIGGVVGAGGGLIAIPIIQFLFMKLGLDSATAMLMTVGTSSLSMIFGSTLATVREARQGLLDWDLMKRWIVPIILGVVAGQVLGLGQSGHAMKLIYALMVTGIAVYMMVGSEKWRLHDGVPKGPIWGLYGSIIGFVCSLTGSGGTAIAIPLQHSCGIRLHRAIINSCTIGLMVGVPSSFFYLAMPTVDLPFTIGSVNLLAVAILVLAGRFGRPLGLWVQRRMSAELLHKAFVLVLLVTATRLCWVSLAA